MAGIKKMEVVMCQTFRGLTRAVLTCWRSWARRAHGVPMTDGSQAGYFSRFRTWECEPTLGDPSISLLTRLSSSLVSPPLSLPTLPFLPPLNSGYILSKTETKLKQNNFTETKHCFTFVLFQFYFSSISDVTTALKVGPLNPATGSGGAL